MPRLPSRSPSPPKQTSDPTPSPAFAPSLSSATSLQELNRSNERDGRAIRAGYMREGSGNAVGPSRGRSWKEVLRPKEVVRFGRRKAHEGFKRYKRASLAGKAALWGIVAINVVILLAVVIITPHRIGLFVEGVANKLRGFGVWGMLLCFVAVVLASHPPLFGFAGSMTLIGFTFGLWPGALIAVAASMTGAGIAFLSVRTFFLKWMQRFGASRSDKWEAFSQVIKAKGTLLIIMIRWCPLPWALGNGMFASIESVSFKSFMLANFLVQPRLLVPVFIGSRLKSLSGDEPKDPVTKWVNAISIITTMSVSIGTGYFIYRSTLQKMRELDAGGETEADLREARDLLEENALLGDFSDFGSDDEEGGSTPTTAVGPANGQGKHLGVRFGPNSTAPALRRNSGSSTDVRGA